MRIMFLGNNWLGWQALRWLRSQDEELVGAVLHPENTRKYGDEILDALEIDPSCVFDGSRLNDPVVIEAIKQLRVDLGLSVMFGYILRPELIAVFRRGCINVHTSLLPYNRGAYPNVWSIVDRTPAGATLHFVDRGIDTGDIIAQRPVEVEPVDTGLTLQRKLESAALELLTEQWPLIRAGQTARTPQLLDDGSFHRVKEVDAIDRIDPNASYEAGRLIDIIRARTFPPFSGAYMVVNGRKVYLRLELEYEKADVDR